MVQHGLDYMRLNADVRHAGRGRAAEIVQGPGDHRLAEFFGDLRVEPELAPGP